MQSESGTVQSTRVATPSAPPPSVVLGGEPFDKRYTLRRLLAQSTGAMVYAAEHRFTRRAVALKIPRDSTSSPAFARVRREIEALALARGEGVVEMLDAGEVGGKPYIVFELLEGRTLAGLLAARGQLSPEEVIQVGIDAAQALQHCHERGVVHRDLKPSNLFVTLGNPRREVTLGNQGRVKILDFGIAKLLTTHEIESPKLTRETAVLGTPEYMAPESLIAAHAADHRADLYGLGVTLFECLTGSVPFEGHYGEVLMKVSTGRCPPIREQRPEVPEALAQVIERCLQREPQDRFAGMRELCAALEAAREASDGSVSLLKRPERAPERKETDTLADVPSAKAKTGVEARRKHPRAPYITLARINFSNGQRVDGRIEEISEGGLQFVGDRAIDAGSAVRIRFALPATGRITEVGATARWNRSARGNNASGFQFDDISESAQSEIRQYVQIMCRD